MEIETTLCQDDLRAVTKAAIKRSKKSNEPVYLHYNYDRDKIIMSKKEHKNGHGYICQIFHYAADLEETFLTVYSMLMYRCHINPHLYPQQ